MKKSHVLIFLTFLVVTNILFIGTTILYKNKLEKQVFKVYSFEGEDNNIRINNGVIIISPDKEILSGGEIEYIGDRQEKIYSYSKTIYLSQQGNKEILLSNSVSSDQAMNFIDEFPPNGLNGYVGKISSEKLFSKEDLNIIKDNLYFSLSYSTVDGKLENFTIKLKVKEIILNETK